MPEINQQVLDTVREELKKTPSPGSKQLYEIAMGVEPSIAQNSLQQFHARYVLPIKREQAAARAGGSAKRAARKPKKEAAPVRKAEEKAPRSRRRSEAAREKEPEKTHAQPRRRRSGVDRDQVRSLFLQFARDFANAESRGEIVEVLSSVDRYVDRVVNDS